MMYVDSAQLNALAEQAEAGIAEVPVKADVLREIVEEAKKYRELSKRYPAPERDPRDGRAKPKSFLLMSSMKHMAEKHFGNSFAMLENTIGFLEQCFLYIHLGEYDAAKQIIGALDGGYAGCMAEDLRRFEQAVEQGWLEADVHEKEDEQVVTNLKCITCRDTLQIKGHWHFSPGYSSAKVFYSNHKPYPDARLCRTGKKPNDSLSHRTG